MTKCKGLVVTCLLSGVVCGVSGQRGTPACRTLASAYTSSTNAGSFIATVTASCSFDAAGRRGSCTHKYTDTAGTSSTSTSVTLYNSIADFVDEVRVVPPLTKVLSSTGTMVSKGTTTTGSQVNTYDAQGRITRTESNPGQPGASTTTYTAWDTSGRPTVATDAGRGFNNKRDITYDDAARTRTTRVNSGVVVTVETFDVNGNLTRQTASGGPSSSTTVFTTTATTRVCK